MAYSVDVREDLGVYDSTFVARGDTPADVIDAVAKHLREEHDIDLPSTEIILTEEQIDAGTEDVQLIVKRLRKVLDLDGDVASTDTTDDASIKIVPPGDMPGNL